jgi:hypothetical protein
LKLITFHVSHEKSDFIGEIRVMTNMMKSHIKLTVASLVTIIAVMLTASLVWAQDGARVFPQPLESPEGTLVVDIMAENVTDLYGAEFRLTYDPSVVAVQDFKPEQDGVQIESGTLLPSGKGFVVANQVDEAAGTVIFAMTLLNPASPVTGSGPLARVTFKVLQDVPSTINVEHAKLVAVDLQTIPSHTEAFAIGDTSGQQPASPLAAEAPAASAPALNNEVPPVSAPAKTAPAPVVEEEGFPWWIVAAVIMILGILALGGFIVMDGMKSAAEAKSSRQNSSVDKHSMYRTRPSTFKNH